MNRWNRAGISLVCGDQNAPYNQMLAQAPLTAPGKYGLPLPYVIERKMRGPQQRPRKPYPATPADVAAFLQANAPPIRVTRRGEFEILKTSVSPTGEPAKRYATLSRYLGTLSKLHSDGNHPDPTRDPEVVAVWRVLRRGLERPQQKASLGWEAIRQALVALPNNLAGKRDRARLLLAYTLMARRSELVALNVENFAIDEEGGATVSFERTKTSERATNYLPAEIMAVVGEWLRAAQIRSGAMFVRLDSAGGLNRERLKPQRVASTSTRVAQRLKLPDFDPES